MGELVLGDREKTELQYVYFISVSTDDGMLPALAAGTDGPTLELFIFIQKQ